MLAWLNGSIVPAETAALSIWDLGFTLGVTLSEHFRTYRRQPLFLEDHLQRLAGGLTRVGIELPTEEVRTAIESSLAANAEQIDASSDFGVRIAVTPGDSRQPPSGRRPTLLVHPYELPFERLDHWYRDGLRLTSVSVREFPAQCIPREIKHRNRLHYWLAEREAEQRQPGSRAVLGDLEGNLAEGTIASILIVRDHQLICPLPKSILPGITLGRVLNLHTDPPLERVRRSIALDELHVADELLWCNSTSGIVPILEYDGRPVGQGNPGPGWRSLMDAWIKLIGFSPVDQAAAEARR